MVVVVVWAWDAAWVEVGVAVAGDRIKEHAMTDYFQRHALSATALECLYQDPTRFALEYVQRTHRREATRQMDFGSVVDDMLCGQPPRWAVWTGGPVKGGKKGEPPRISMSKNTDAYREFLAEAETAGLLVVTDRQLTQASAMVRAVRQHVQAGPLVNHPDVAFQVELDWTIGDEDPIPCKAKPDLLIESADVMADLKTTFATSFASVRKQAIALGYHRKQAWYERGYLATRGRKLRDFLFVSVCTDPDTPHVWVWRFGDFTIASANADIDLLIEDYQARTITGDWERDDTKTIQTAEIKPYEVDPRTAARMEQDR